MRRKKAPKPPENKNYWRTVVQDPVKVKSYQTHGNPIQKELVTQAVKYFAWENEQDAKQNEGGAK
jgi:hypothetical protein